MAENYYEYENKSVNYQAVANHHEVILEGTEELISKFVKGFDIGNSQYGIVEMLAPGEKTSGTMVSLDKEIGNEKIDIMSLFKK